MHPLPIYLPLAVHVSIIPQSVSHTTFYLFIFYLSISICLSIHTSFLFTAPYYSLPNSFLIYLYSSLLLSLSLSLSIYLPLPHFPMVTATYLNESSFNPLLLHIQPDYHPPYPCRGGPRSSSSSKSLALVAPTAGSVDPIIPHNIQQASQAKSRRHALGRPNYWTPQTDTLRRPFHTGKLNPQPSAANHATRLRLPDNRLGLGLTDQKSHGLLSWLFRVFPVHFWMPPQDSATLGYNENVRDLCMMFLFLGSSPLIKPRIS